MTKTISSNRYLRLLQWLRQSRVELGLSTRELGSRLGRPNSYVTKTEQAERRLDVAEFVDYCSALGVDPVEGIQLLVAATRGKGGNP